MLRKPLAATIATALALLLGACGSRTGSPAPAAPASTRPAAPPARPARTSPPKAPAAAAEVNPAGDIPDDQVFVRYRPPGAPFSVKVPEGWARTSQGGVVSFTDKLNTIRLQAQPAPAAPTVASARQAELPAIRAASRHLERVAVGRATRKAGTAVLITYRADAPPDPVTGKVVHDAVERYEFWRGGTSAILTLAGPVGADNVDPWRIVTDSLAWR
jgi:hypothetical protein